MACDPQTLVDGAKCVESCLPPGAYLPALISLFCTIRDNGGGGGGLPTGPQAANTFLAGPTSGAAAAPTFRLMVTADLGTTLTPQFARVGIGNAADAAVPLKLTMTGVGNQVAAIFDAPTGNPILTIGTQLPDAGCFAIYNRAANTMQFGIHGHPFPGLTIDLNGNVAARVNMDANTYSSGGIPGISTTFSASDVTTLSFFNGILTSNA